MADFRPKVFPTEVEKYFGQIIKTKPFITLFLLQSFDGKISSGSSDNMDADADFSRIAGVKEGLHQYYELEQETDYFSLNTGRVMAKIGVNDRREYHEKS